MLAWFLSITNHCLSPPVAGAWVGKVMPPSSDRHIVVGYGLFSRLR